MVQVGTLLDLRDVRSRERPKTGRRPAAWFGLDSMLQRKDMVVMVYVKGVILSHPPQLWQSVQK